METITLTKVSKKDADKMGKPYISKAGKPYSRASIQCEEYKDEWFGGFWSPQLVEGAKIEVEITSREYQGKTYKDFKVVKKEDKADQKLEQILNGQVAIKLGIQTILEEMRGRKYPTPEDEGIDLENTPF